MIKMIKGMFASGVESSKSSILKEEYKKGGVKGATKAVLALATLNTMAHAADDEVFQPLVDLLQTWLQGNLGYVIALFVVAGGIIYGALGGGFPTAMKAIFFGLMIGAISFVTEKVFNMGLSFS